MTTIRSQIPGGLNYGPPRIRLFRRLEMRGLTGWAVTYRWNFTPFSTWIEQRINARCTWKKRIERIGRGIRELNDGRWSRRCIRSSWFAFDVRRDGCLFFELKEHPNGCRWLSFQVGWFAFCWVINEGYRLPSLKRAKEGGGR